MARGGIVPSKEPIVDPVTIERGELDSFAPRAFASGTGYFVGGLIFLAIAFAALAGLFVFVPLDVTERMAPSFRPSWREIELEEWIETRVRAPLRREGVLSPSELTSISIPDGGANGRVRAPGRDEFLTRASATQAGDERTITIDDGAVVLVLASKREPKRLTILGEDVPVAQASILVNGLWGRITYFGADRAARVTYNAVER